MWATVFFQLWPANGGPHQGFQFAFFILGLKVVSTSRPTSFTWCYRTTWPHETTLGSPLHLFPPKLKLKQQLPPFADPAKARWPHHRASQQFASFHLSTCTRVSGGPFATAFPKLLWSRECLKTWWWRSACGHEYGWPSCLREEFFSRRSLARNERRSPHSEPGLQSRAEVPRPSASGNLKKQKWNLRKLSYWWTSKLPIYPISSTMGAGTKVKQVRLMNAATLPLAKIALLGCGSGAQVFRPDPGATIFACMPAACSTDNLQRHWCTSLLSGRRELRQWGEPLRYGWWWQRHETLEWLSLQSLLPRGKCPQQETVETKGVYHSRHSQGYDFSARVHRQLRLLSPTTRFTSKLCLHVYMGLSVKSEFVVRLAALACLWSLVCYEPLTEMMDGCKSWLCLALALLSGGWMDIL